MGKQNGHRARDNIKWTQTTGDRGRVQNSGQVLQERIGTEFLYFFHNRKAVPVSRHPAGPVSAIATVMLRRHIVLWLQKSRAY